MMRRVWLLRRTRPMHARGGRQSGGSTGRRLSVRVAYNQTGKSQEREHRHEGALRSAMSRSVNHAHKAIASSPLIRARQNGFERLTIAESDRP
jgi:hypothetical protein